MGSFSKKGKAVVFTAAATGATFAATMFAPMSLVFADTTATVMTAEDLTEALANGVDNITLGANITGSFTVSDTTGKTTIDLGGYTLSSLGETSQAHAITVNIGAEADISNGTIVANKKDAAIYNNGYTTINANVTHTGTATTSFYAIMNHGDMVINGGNISASESVTSSLIENGYYNYAASSPTSGYVPGVNKEFPTLTINGGSFADGFITVKTDEGGITVINDGTFSNKNICIESWNDTTINGGQFTGAGNESVCYAGKYNSHTDGTLKIKGGKFTGRSLIASVDAYTEQANVTIESADFSGVDRLFSDSTSTKKPTVTIAETSAQPQTTSTEFITDITWDDENSANRPGLAKFKEMLTVVDDNGNPLTANIELSEDPNNASVTIVKYTVNYDKYNADGTEAAVPNAKLTIDNDKLQAAGYEAVNPDSPFILSPKPQEPTDTIEPTEPSKPTKDNKTDIKLNSAEGQKAPQTGVTSNAPLYTLLAAGAVGGACVAAWAIKRKTAK